MCVPMHAYMCHFVCICLQKANTCTHLDTGECVCPCMHICAILCVYANACTHLDTGAMENKGLNIFNTAYILAKPSTGT